MIGETFHPELGTLDIEIIARPLVWIPTIDKIYMRHRFGVVYLIMGDKVQPLTTTMAYDMGIAILFSDVAPNEMFMLSINGEQVKLPSSIARRVAIGLVRKADDADDWQMQNSTRKLQ